jgi:hypothetical protein
MIICDRLCRQFGVLLSREWQVYRKRLPGFLVTFMVVSPMMFTLMQGYFKPLMYFGYPLGRKALLIFSGALIIRFIHRSFNFATSLFFDVHKQRNVQFQSQGVPLWLIYLARITISVFMTWLFLLPVVPIARLYLGSNMQAPDLSWGHLFGVMGLVSVMMNTYAFMCVSSVSTFYGISKIRVRLNEILMWLGAFNATWLVVARSGRIWGILGLLNPFTYGTEAFRQAITPGGDILPFYITLPALLMWSVLFFFIGYWFLSRHVWPGRYVPDANFQTTE